MESLKKGEPTLFLGNIKDTMGSITDVEKKSWKPDRPTSKGASAFHEAVIDASWNHECLDEIVKIVNPYLGDGDVVVDFGAGTGTSSIRFLERIKKKIRLWLVDNSPAWLGKAYELLKDNPDVDFYLLENKDGSTATLSETVGKSKVNQVLSANTVHLIPNLEEAFRGVEEALKTKGVFVFNSGNITREGKPEGALMLDSTVYRVHDIAIDIIKREDKYARYRENLDERIKQFLPQRKFIFPYPRDIKDYVKALKEAGFKQIEASYKRFRVKYSDYLNFLRVKRLQSGMLPEVGGKKPSPEEEKDRDEIITKASKKLFKELEEKNPLADSEAWQCEWAYVFAKKEG